MRSPFLSNVTSWRSCNWYVCSLWCFTSAACYHLPRSAKWNHFPIIWSMLVVYFFNLYRYSLQLQFVIPLDRQMDIDDTRPTSILRRRLRSARQELLNSWKNQVQKQCCCTSIWPPESTSLGWWMISICSWIQGFKSSETFTKRPVKLHPKLDAINVELLELSIRSISSIWAGGTWCRPTSRGTPVATIVCKA